MIDGRPYFVAGYTPGGAPYGIYLEEMDDGYLTEVITPGRPGQAEFTLTPVGDERTRVRDSEGGHEVRDWSEAEKQRYADEHREGWGDFLECLVGVAREHRSG